MIKSGVEDCLGEVTVGIEVRPLSLALETGCNGVVANHFLFSSLGQIRIAVHQILNDQVHLQREVPILVLLLAGTLQFFGVLVKTFNNILCSPGFQLFKFLLVIDAFRHAADHFDLVN